MEFIIVVIETTEYINVKLYWQTSLITAETCYSTEIYARLEDNGNAISILLWDNNHAYDDGKNIWES